MKTAIKLSFASRIFGIVLLLSALVLDQGCKKENQLSNDPASTSGAASGGAAGQLNPGKGYNVVNLVSDVSDYSPAHIDANLVNAWGLAFGPTGGVWVSSNEKGLSAIYDQNGNTLRPPVSIPFGDNASGAAVSGQVYNYTHVFMMPPSGTPVTTQPTAAISAAGKASLAKMGDPSKFIFSTENGTIAAWGSGGNAVTMADRSSTGAVYKGIEIASDNGAFYLYATDFHNGKIDVFDENFNYVDVTQVNFKPFSDPSMPAGFAPFNIKKVGANLVVTYAKQKAPDNKDDQSGLGNGYVNLFRTNGTLIMRLASGGMLNSPWGIATFKSNMGFGVGADNDQGEMADNDDQGEIANSPFILIGNFGDGHINAFDRSGKFVGQLMHNGTPVVIDGLWAISYAPQHNAAYRDSRNRLYFTAGPADESHGVFGYIARAEIKE